MKIEQQFVTYEIALKLKELGFNEPLHCFDETFWYINGNISLCNDEYKELFPEKEYVIAPLYQQTIQWFMDNCKLYITINPYNDEELFQTLYYFEITDKDFNVIEDYTYYHSYRECLDAAILEAIELTIEESSTNIASTTEM